MVQGGHFAAWKHLQLLVYGIYLFFFYYRRTSILHVLQGGHFAAWEQPQLLAQEIHKFADMASSKGWLA
jgi:hypothetical protein